MLFAILGVIAVVGSLYFAYQVYRNKTLLKYTDGSLVPVVQVEMSSLGDFTKILRRDFGSKGAAQIWLVDRPALVVTDPTLARKFSEDPNFFNRPLTWPFLLASHNKGILASNDLEYHRLHRTLALKGLMKTNVLRNTASVILEKTNLLLNEIASKPSTDEGITVEMGSRCHAIALDIIAKAGFSIDFEQNVAVQEKFQNGVNTVLEGTAYYGGFPEFAKLWLQFTSKYQTWLKTHKEVEKIVQDIVSDRRKSGDEQPDYLNDLLHAKDPKTHDPISDQHIFVDTFNILAAGHETTAYTLNFALHALSLHPHWQEEAQQEISKFSEEPTYEDAREMKILHAIVKETLRLFPISTATGRSNVNATEFNGIQLPPNTLVIANLMQSMRNGDYYKNPNSFDPQRWLEESHSKDDEMEKKPERPEDIAWLPFGAGARSCAGMRMALLEAKLILFAILRRYSLKPVSESKLDLEIHSAPTMRPTKPFKIMFVPRK